MFSFCLPKHHCWVKKKMLWMVMLFHVLGSVRPQGEPVIEKNKKQSAEVFGICGGQCCVKTVLSTQITDTKFYCCTPNTASELTCSLTSAKRHQFKIIFMRNPKKIGAGLKLVQQCFWAVKEDPESLGPNLVKRKSIRECTFAQMKSCSNVLVHGWDQHHTDSSGWEAPGEALYPGCVFQRPAAV